MDALGVRLRGGPRLAPGRLPRTQDRPGPHDRRSIPPDPLPITRGDREPGTALYFAAIALAGILIFVPVPALIIIAQEFVPGAPATASGMVLGLGSALAGIGYIVLGRVQEAVGLTNGIRIGFSMVVPAALIALVVLLRGRGETPVPAQ
jgi:hypothetical protein